MLTLIAENLLWFVLAFLIGVGTAWWVWARYAVEANAEIEAAPVATAAPVAQGVHATSSLG